MHILRVTGFLVCALVILGFVGLTHDAFDEFEFSRSAPTWWIWVGGLVLAGLFYTVSDGLFEWVAAPDPISDPLGRRVVRLTAAIVLVLVVTVVAILAVRTIA